MAQPDERIQRFIRVRFGGDARVDVLSALNHDVFRVHGPGVSRIFKVARPGDATSIERELAVLGWAADHGIPVPVVEEADAAGKAWGRPYLLMNDAGAERVADWIQRPGPIAGSLFREMGVWLARVHSLDESTPRATELSARLPRRPARDREDLVRMARRFAADGRIDREAADWFEA
jgi:aminoglycoside phosphotransferase